MGDRGAETRRFRSYPLQVKCHLTSCISRVIPLHHLFLSCWLEPALQEISCLSRIRPGGFRHYALEQSLFPAQGDHR